MNLHIIVHESFEAPGAVELWAEKKHHNVTYSRVYLGEKLPETTDSFDYLIVMGGPQCPATTLEECAHFDAQAEIALIRKAADAGKLILGVCLGAQLIGEALGARFDHSPNREIGVYDLELTEFGRNDPIFSTFPEVFAVGHWHGDMPGLTETAEVLATSQGCPRQIVRYTPKIYGFQCHFEFTSESIEGMIASCAHELGEYKDLPYIENADKLRSHDFTEINGRLYTFLDAMEELYRSTAE